jgi:hypothetical protein
MKTLRASLMLALPLTILGGPLSRPVDARDKSSAVASQFEPVVAKMLEAVKASSYDDFIAAGGEKFKATAKPSFSTASSYFGPMLKKGYKTTFLTTLRKDDHELLLWKLAIPGGKDDFEVRIAIANGKVEGFWLV